LAINLENAIELEKLEYKSEGNSLLLNTLLFFQYQGYSDNMLYTYIASIYLVNNITPEKVQNFLESTINHKVCIKTIKKCLTKLYILNYLRKNLRFNFQLARQKIVTQYHTHQYDFDIPKFKTFLDSKIKIHDETFDIYTESKFKNFKLFLFSELICIIYHNEPVSKSRLRNDLRLNGNEIKELSKGFLTKYKLSKGIGSNGHNVNQARINEEYNSDSLPNCKKHLSTAVWKDENDYLHNKKVAICVGNIYTKDHFATTIKLNKFTKVKLDKTFDENNYIEKESKRVIAIEDKGRVVNVDGSILLLSRENKTSFGIRKNQNIDALSGNYETMNTRSHYPQLASNSYVSTCCNITRLIGYGKREIDLKDNKKVLNLYGNLIVKNSLHNKEVLLTGKKDIISKFTDYRSFI
jgi:hypothetical protein